MLYFKSIFGGSLTIVLKIILQEVTNHNYTDLTMNSFSK